MPKLLIVDDEIDIREFSKRFFQKRNIDVLTASGGREALKLIEDESPDLVLLDVHMEEINGIEVLKSLRERNDNTNVIMVTGAEEEHIINEATNWGIKGYIHKPLVLEELEKIVLTELL
ncbi:MAG: response regulator [Candidatus Omnitrophica bacterium]|nr:response regulator [Candidatus Omnitrophota bacterium]